MTSRLSKAEREHAAERGIQYAEEDHPVREYRRVVLIKDRATGQEIGSMVQDDLGQFHLQEQGTLISNESLPHIVRRLITAIGEIGEQMNRERPGLFQELKASEHAIDTKEREAEAARLRALNWPNTATDEGA